VTEFVKQATHRLLMAPKVLLFNFVGGSTIKNSETDVFKALVKLGFS
jgi:hypothetical protein